MLQSLAKIGELLLEGKGEFTPIINEPKIKEDAKYYTLEIVVDLDEQEVIVTRENLREYREGDPYKYYRIIGLPPKSPKAYVCVDGAKPHLLSASLWETSEGKNDHFLYEIDGKAEMYEDVIGTPFYNALKMIHQLGARESLGKNSLNGFVGKNESIPIVYVSVKSEELEAPAPKFLGAFDGYTEYLRARYLGSDSEDGFCYVANSASDGVDVAKFEGRNSFNKIFVTTTINYASGFDKRSMSRNYQTGAKMNAALSKAAAHLQQNMGVQIAKVQHFIVPQFPEHALSEISEEIFGKDTLQIKSSSELLFKWQKFDDFVGNIEDELQVDGFYWLNFIGYESDGKSYKVVNHIRDVPLFHFQKIAIECQDVSRKIADVFRKEATINLATLYYSIPIRKDSVKNPALPIFNALLEKREIDAQELFRHFIELILCHWYGRDAAYANITKNENFDYAIFDAVLRYHGFFHLLQRLDQLTNHNFGASMTSSYETLEQDYFERMNYSDPQKALFYLGKLLGVIAYAQYKKGHKQKPVMGKINYRGMGRDQILRLVNDLMEKARQYSVVDRADFPLRSFNELFNPNEWTISEEEAVFFILAGYSHRAAKSEEESNQDDETETLTEE
ncbi:MAG: hypothetical protein GF419_00960 [Ignavibacteriales bacterium]|nr:hypothetical protein [Ignavibacteriales bacterium]